MRRVVAEKDAEALLAQGHRAAALRLLQANFDCATWTMGRQNVDTVMRFQLGR